MRDDARELFTRETNASKERLNHMVCHKYTDKIQCTSAKDASNRLDPLPFYACLQKHCDILLHQDQHNTFVSDGQNF